MSYFAQAADPSLYLWVDEPSAAGSLAFILPAGVTAPSPKIELDQAWRDDALAGSFVFAPTAQDFGGDAAKQQAYVEGIRTVVARKPASRDVLWAASPALVAAGGADPAAIPSLGLAADGASVASALAAPITGSVGLLVSSGMTLTLAGTTLELSGAGNQYAISFAGAAAPQMSTVLAGRLPFAGEDRGCVQFDPYLQRRSLGDTWRWGFSFAFARPASPQGVVSEWLPLADASDAGSDDMLGFSATIDPLRPFYRPASGGTILRFSGRNADGERTRLASFYRTAFGAAVHLVPVAAAGTAGLETGGLVFAQGQRLSETQDAFNVGPIGDFVIDAAPGPDGRTADLLCGLRGNERIALVPGTDAASGARLRFRPGEPAFVSQFPLPPASPVGPPSDPTASPLGTDLTTSWATVLPPTAGTSAATYVAQPRGFPLFGYDAVVAPVAASLLGAVDPGLELSAQAPPFFPLPCYGGLRPGDGNTAFSGDQVERFETQVLGPARHAAITAGTTRRTVSARGSAGDRALAQQDGIVPMTTPSGILAMTDAATGVWSKLLLGRTVTPSATEMSFVQPSAALQDALQSSDLCLVVANAGDLVAPSGRFLNRLDIGRWLIEAAVGRSPAYGDYANVMIVKGVKGPLFDPAGDPARNLVASPDKWTKAATFAAPSTADQPPDPGQLTALSQWLQDYFADAAQQPDADFFGPFNALAKDPNWTGILVLRARIAAPPGDIAGILAGLKDPSRFYAHHLSIAISQIALDPATKQITVDDQSAINGLIDYLDPACDPRDPDLAVPPAPGLDYDFRVLTLKVQFENTAVKRFASLTQLTLNRLFGSAVTGMSGGAPYNSILLTGTFQNNDGSPAYNLGSKDDAAFLFDSNVLNKIEIASAALTTTSGEAGRVGSVFALAGFIDFKQVATGASPPLVVDLFSFGSPASGPLPRHGLAFAGLAITMTFDPARPADRSLVFDASPITFDLQTSTPRAGSLFEALALELQGLSQGTKPDDLPTKQGYLNVVTDLRLGGFTDAWTGLRFRLNLGTPGALAGAAGLNATLLLAWAPDSRGESLKALVAVRMPGASSGAKLISLQTVLSLSYGIIQLLLLPRADGSGRQFVLVMNEIAIKLLGVLKVPPSGNTAFYLFGASDAGADAQSGLGWFTMYAGGAKSAGLTSSTSPDPYLTASGS